MLESKRSLECVQGPCSRSTAYPNLQCLNLSRSTADPKVQRFVNLSARSHVCRGHAAHQGAVQRAPAGLLRQVIKFVSGGSRMGDSKRSAANCPPLRAPNEDAFKVGNYCFAVADGYEGALL